MKLTPSQLARIQHSKPEDAKGQNVPAKKAKTEVKEEKKKR